MVNKVNIFIDNKPITCDAGITVIKAADDAGIYIPRFCYHEKLSVVANCRMCLVEVVGVPKTLPACATYVTDGMRVLTRSSKTLESQKAVMEFLLINHPLDCPICDQGGECELQDISMGFGTDISQYTKGKRVVDDEDLGPLVATDMTRCIQCTRCVRFGTEIAGIEELGTLNRGGLMEIGTYLKKGLKSELSGNVIDLCPVGALTSKPYRFNGRSWGFKQYASVSFHDGVGSNLFLHSIHNGLQHNIMRVVPKSNESINENWLSDRDRFSYEGVMDKQRLTHPMIKTNGEWKQTSWESVLPYLADCITQTVQNYQAKNIASIAHPSSTNEEFWLLQQLMRKIGCDNLDHRLRQEDFSDTDQMPHHGLPVKINEIEHFSTFVLIGANPRNHQPLLNHRIKKGIHHGAQCIQVNSSINEPNFPIAQNILVPYSQWADFFSKVLYTLCEMKKITHRLKIKPKEISKEITEFTKTIAKHKKTIFLLGPIINEHPHASIIRQIIREITLILECEIAYLTEGANASGAVLAGMLPNTPNGMNFKQMFDTPRKLYWLQNVEPLHDCAHPDKIIDILTKAFVISCNRYDSPELRAYSDIILPICTPAEMGGSFTNLEGKIQRFNAAIKPIGESKAGWKVIAAVAKTMVMDGFQYTNSQDIQNEIETVETPSISENTLPKKIPQLPHPIMWVHDVHELKVDDIVRHANALQTSISTERQAVRFNKEIAESFKIFDESGLLYLTFGKKSIKVPYIIDENTANDTMIIPDTYAIHFPRHCPIKLRAVDA